MNFAITELFDIGFFHIAFDLSNSPMTIAFWVCIIIGAIIGLITFNKYKKASSRLIPFIILLLLLFIFEIICQIITGWDLFLYLLIYGALLLLLAGALLSFLILLLTKKLNRREKETN